MSRTLAILFTMTTYGTWLRGDRRGWVKDGIEMPPNALLEVVDRKSLNHEPYRFPSNMRMGVGDAIGASLIQRMRVDLLAMCICSNHIHFMTGPTRVHVETVVKCAKDAARWHLRIDRPIWGVGYDKRFCFDVDTVVNRIKYVEEHNLDDGLDARPWGFLKPWAYPR
jgi:hypothetical protein